MDDQYLAGMTFVNEDARGLVVQLKTPCCKRNQRASLPAVAIDVRKITCRSCQKLWLLKTTPLKATGKMVVRKVEWLLLDGPNTVEIKYMG